jgi:uncharacterized membrane protein required for colicin V production
MTSADITIAIALGIFVLSGFFEGIVKKLLGLVILIIAFFAALHTYQGFAHWLQAAFSQSELVSSVLAFLIIFLVVLIIGNVLYRLTGKGNEFFKVWDRLAGAGFGLLEGAILISLALHLLTFIDIPSEATRNASSLYPIIYSIAPTVFDAINLFIPQVREFFELFIQDVEVPENLTL